MLNARSWLVESAAIGAGALGFEPAFLCSTTRHTARFAAHEVRAVPTAADTDAAPPLERAILIACVEAKY